MGQEVLRHLSSDTHVRVSQIVVPEAIRADALMQSRLMCPDVQVRSSVDLSASGRPQLLVECAGHTALREHVLPALEGGVPCIVASVGALSDSDLAGALEQAAATGGAPVRLISGALGALDALASAQVGGVDEVLYVGRKPPLSWSATPAASLHDLKALRECTVIFEGSAREASRLYPKNANVAASVALAGIGFERTHVRLLADPAIAQNIHTLVVRGAFGEFQMELKNLPLASNPKTSALTVYSLVRAIWDSRSPIHF